MNQYPLQVQQKTNILVDAIEDIINEDDDLGRNEIENMFAEKLFKHFIQGNELELNEIEIQECIEKAMIDTVYNNLVSKGILDSIEDGKDIVYFLTPLGKEVTQYLS